MASLRSLASTAGWGLFCSSSWTWCIGMYLPVILLRHWGWPGFWVFATFNVLGCAGFGYLCSRERSERLCAEHAGAMALFSAVTVAYQVFFVAFLATWLLQLRDDPISSPVPVTWLACFGAIVVGTILSILPDRWWPWLGSLAAAASYGTWVALGAGRLGDAASHGGESHLSLAMAAPIIAFGFLLCPWLDRTFHRARQLAPSVHAFGVFGVTFLPIILMTVAYGATGTLDPTAPILTHLTTQLLFTIAVHLRELRLSPVPQSIRLRRWAILGPALGGLAVAECWGLVGGTLETAYLLFLGCYGLLFPAYVLLFVPMRTAERLGMRAWPLNRRAIGLFAVLIALLSPLCAAGFIGLKTWMLPIALAAVLLAALLGRSVLGPARRAGVSDSASI